MIKRKRKDKKVYGPILVMGFGLLGIMFLSLVLSLIGVESQVPIIENGSLEMNLVTINNIFSKSGIKYLLSSAVTNFSLMKPLVLLIISLIATSICETSGLLKHITLPLKKLSLPLLTIMTLLLSVVLTIFGDYSFIALLPIIGTIYRYAGRNPMLGILTVFIGITCSYGTGMIYNYNTYLLGTVTQLSASIEVDPTFTYDVLSCAYIMIVSALVVVVLGTIIINKYLVPKFKKTENYNDELKLSNKALWINNIIVLVILIATVLMILPGGILLDNSQPTYIAKLMSESSPFKDALIFIVLITVMICGAVYGKITGNIYNRLEYNVGLYKSFNNTGYVFVLMFFCAFINGILNWTNIGTVLSAKLINFVSSLQLSGGLLIGFFFAIVIIIGIVVTDSYTKWSMSGPLIVPLFMRSNITPEFTQFIFGVADGIGKALSPFFIYFIITLGFLQKFNDENTKEITIFGMIKLILPVVLMIMIIWLVLIISWNIVGLPLGISTYATM